MNLPRPILSGELRILIVEDQIADAELCERELERAGLCFTARRVVTRADFETALDRFAPDLILADFALPGNFDGLAALEIAREKRPEVPFVFISGAMGEELAVEAMRRGAADYVLKERLGRLDPVVKRVLERSRLRREKELAETALHEIEVKYRDLVEQAADGIFVTDRTGRILFANSRYCEMLGYGGDELTGRNIAETYPEEERADLPGRLAQLAEIRARLFERSMRRKDGARFPVEISVRYLADGTHQGIVRDITQRKRAEEELRELTRRLVALQETERRGLARELHDRLGQNLSALGVNLSQLRSAPIDGARARELVADSLRLLEEAGTIVSDVLTELKPPMLASSGLLEALRWSAREFTRRTRVPVEVRGMEPAPRLSPEIEMALFRIAQAALGNIAQHARARRVQITLERTGNRFRFEIADDGAGFDVEQALASGRWGLEAMRERAEAIGGKLDIQSAPGRGTRIVIEADFA